MQKKPKFRTTQLTDRTLRMLNETPGVIAIFRYDDGSSAAFHGTSLRENLYAAMARLGLGGIGSATTVAERLDQVAERLLKPTREEDGAVVRAALKSAGLFGTDVQPALQRLLANRYDEGC